jgi:predicted phosphate transport protein (TIGR00153 family)
VKKVDSVIRFLLPKEERFHELLDQGTENLVQAVRLFSEMAHSANPEERRVKMIRLKALEHEGDMVTKQVFDALNASFITPFDRDDIQNIAIDLDDILDNLEGAAQYLILFELQESPDALRHFSDILVSMAEEIHEATGMIWDQKNERRVREVIVRVSELENQADQLYNTVIADLFKSTGRNPLEIMKWKEVYQGLEEACDSCRDYSNIISNVVVKNA